MIEACDLFIWDEDIGVKSENEYGSILNSELEVMGYLKELYEDTKKKNKNLKIELKVEEFSRKLKMFCFVIFFMFNLYFVLKCNCW